MANSLNNRQLIQVISQRQRSLIARLGNNTKNFFQITNFEAQGFIDTRVKRWKPVATKKPGEKILVRTGRLRRSATSTVKSPTRAEVSFQAPYASYVDRSRQIVGKSATLDKQNRKIIERHFLTVFK